MVQLHQEVLATLTQRPEFPPCKRAVVGSIPTGGSMEAWPSGLRQGIANPSYVVRCTGGSNPLASAGL